MRLRLGFPASPSCYGHSSKMNNKNVRKTAPYFTPALRKIRQASVLLLGRDVVARPQPREQFGDDQVAAVGAFGRGADVPVRGDVVGRRVVIRQRDAALHAVL